MNIQPRNSILIATYKSAETAASISKHHREWLSPSAGTLRNSCIRGIVATICIAHVIVKLKIMPSSPTKMPPRKALQLHENMFTDSRALHFPLSQWGTASIIMLFVKAEHEFIKEVFRSTEPILIHWTNDICKKGSLRQNIEHQSI